MTYEVEMKFPLADVAAFETRLATLGATISPSKLEVDAYFNHPARDFRETDEALRIRRKESANWITYKGPKLDPTTKTRHEIDLPLPPGEPTAAAWTGMLTALGFRMAGEVRKQRRKAAIDWKGHRVDVSLDEVERLGAFAELELIVEADELELAKACIASLAAHLRLEHSERRSYLELVGDRHLTNEEAERYQRIREQVAAEMPDIRRRAQVAKPRVLLKHVLRNLREERQRQGLSLADVKQRSGIDRGTLSKLENDEDPNVTMNTLMRYAEAVGKVVMVELEEVSPR